MKLKTNKTTKSKTIKAGDKVPVASPDSRPVAASAPVKATTRATMPSANKKPAAMTSVPPREITTELIAARAYILWEQQGRPHGNDVQNWLLAENQLKQEVRSFTA